MGRAHSVQYNDMVQTYNPFEWRQLEDHQQFQVWQSIPTGKKHAVFPINISQADSQQNVQIYHFRKLNYLHLVSAEAILRNGNNIQFCSEPKGLKVLIQYIPVRLAQINKKLGFLQRLSVLYSIFAGLHTINYLYGPLYITQHMVGFTQNGKPKIWINEDFSKNEPSRVAKGEVTDSSGIEELQLLENEMLVAEEMLNCVTQVFKTAGNSDVETYPYDFRVEAANVRTFSEGEELIQNYCRSKGIELMENIAFWEYLKEDEFEQSVTHNNTWMSLLQHSNPPSNQNILVESLGFKQLPTQRPKRQLPQPVNLQKSTTRWNVQQPQTLLRSSLHPSNTKITINYGGQTLRRSQHQQVVTSMNVAPNVPPLVFNVKHQPRIEENVVSFYVKEDEQRFPPAIVVRMQDKQVPKQQVMLEQQPIQPKKQIIFQQPIQPVVSEHVLKTYVNQPLGNPPLIQHMEDKVHLVKRQSLAEVDQIKEEPQQTVQVVEKDKIEIADQDRNQDNSLAVPNKHVTQESQAENSSNMTAYNTIDEIKMWEASLISKLSTKKAEQQQQQEPQNNQPQYQHLGYQSCESQEDSEQVRFGGAQSESLQNIKDMQAYIRNKYRDYLTNTNENGIDSSETDSNGGNEKLYSFGLKPSAMSRGRQNELIGLKRNVFRRRTSISENVQTPDTGKAVLKDPIVGFMSKAKKLGIDSQSKIIYEESARQSGRQSESQARNYTTALSRIRHKESLYSFHNGVSQRQESSTFQGKKSQNSSYGKLQDRYNKYVINKDKRGTQQNKSQKLINNQVKEQNQTNYIAKDKYYVDSINESRTITQQSPRPQNNLRSITTPTQSRQEIAHNYLTYDSLRDFLRK